MKNYTDLQQSKKLAEILPIESADMYYAMTYIDAECNRHYNTPARIKQKNAATYETDIPAWSLAALIDILPEGTRLLKSTNISSVGDTKYHCDCPKGNIDKWFDNPVDACYEMIIYLHELNLL